MKGIPANFFERLRARFAVLMEKDIFIIIMSVVAAILIWFTITIIEYPEISQQISGVAIEVVTEGTYAAEHNYQVAGMSATTVVVELDGTRSEIGDIKADDLIAEVSAEGVLSAKDYVLPITVKSKNGRVFKVSSVEPSQVMVNFEEIVTRNIDITANTDSISLADGYMIDPENVAVSPSVVAVKGPKDTVDRITHIVLDIPAQQATSASFEMNVRSSDMKVYNSNVQIQNVLDDLTFDRTDFNVKVPVYRKQTVDLDVTILNAPDTFDIEAFKRRLKMSADTLEIAALDQTSELTSLNIGAIDIRQVDFNNSEDMEFEFFTSEFLQDGNENLSEIQSVVVTIPFTDISKKNLMIPSSNIRLINSPVGYEFQIITSGIQPLFIGPTKQINALAREDIVAYVDMTSSTITTSGDYKLTVQFSIPGYTGVWSAENAGVLSQKVTVTVTRGG
jgi:YbbR domain-containing protein